MRSTFSGFSGSSGSSASSRAARRTRRVTTCTALVLSAGMLFSTPAVADSAPRPVPEAPTKARTAPSQLDLSPLAGPSDRARTAQASAVVKPRFDVDGDGKSDLINREWDGAVYTVLTSDAAGGAWTGLGGSTVLSQDIIPIGDQDGSRGPEVLTLTKYGRLELFADADATSGTFRWAGNGWNIYNKVFSPGDVNGDGRADLMARRHNGDLYQYLATGSRTAPFGAPTKVGYGWGLYDQIVGVGDNDGDGKGDVVARDTNGGLFFYGSTGNTAAPLKARKSIGTGWNIYNQIAAGDDMNGDGRADLFARDRNGALWAYAGLGDGRVAERRRISSDGLWISVDQFGGGGGIPSSGKNAFLGRDARGTLFWYGALNNGKIGARKQWGDVGGWSGANITYVSSTDRGTFGHLLETYQGRLYDGDVDLGRGWQIYNLLIGPGDLNGDGKGDLLARDGSGVLWLYPGNGEGTSFGGRVKVGSGWNAYNRIVGAGDYSGDGRTDLVARDGAGVLWMYRGTGSATTPFSGRVRIGSGWGAYKQIVAPGDIDGDGKGDLLAVASNGNLLPYISTGTGKFTLKAKIGTGFQIYPNLY
ncbi:FG-GAP repeat domain-containing protein [Streptomyces sp. NPDC088557]|uniref:FG-GAP repeat domain-containing protein n=1 Tax=Streptomyces sp. NPDC088557 TaxID=3365867 RepID=UPI003818EE9E